MLRWCALYIILYSITFNEQTKAAIQDVPVMPVVKVVVWKQTLRSTGWVIVDSSTKSAVVSTMGGCVQDCTKQVKCQVAMYDEGTRICKQYHDLGVLQLVVATPSQLNSTVVFVRRLSGVVHASRGKTSSTLEEAKSDCASLNAVPLSYSQMSTLTVHGFYHCNCGWLSNEKPVNTLVQSSDGTCPSETDRGQIHECKIHIGAWCKPGVSYN